MSCYYGQSVPFMPLLLVLIRGASGCCRNSGRGRDAKVMQEKMSWSPWQARWGATCRAATPEAEVARVGDGEAVKGPAEDSVAWSV